MDTSTYKRYHIHGLDSRQLLEHYLSDKPEMNFQEDLLKFPIENLAKVFKDGHIKGDVLLDLSPGSMVHHLYAACEFFKDIIVLKIKDRCIMELKRWVDTRTGAFHWGHAAKLHVDIEGKSNRIEDKDEKVRSSMQHVVKCDLEKENMTAPIFLPPADCIICAWLLDAMSNDQNDYIRYLRKFSGLLKSGGHLILIGDLGATFFTVGKDKLHEVTYDEAFVRKALDREGFIIDYCKVFERTAESDLADYKGIIFVAAYKK